MTTEDGATDAGGHEEGGPTGGNGPAEGRGEATPVGAPLRSPLSGVPATDQLMGLGALLIILVSDLLGDIFLDDYSISRLTWLVAVAVVVALWAHHFGGRQLPIPYRTSMVVLGYAGLLLGIREFIADLDGSFLEGATIVYAVAAYIGAILLGLGAYRMARNQ